uniref:TctD transcriptional regulator n=1 Tax=Centroceras clavulatum TaxID=159503 RepID=A0A4D6WQV0_9FLOR|nr:hypothetical protein [Centroceras clavulatum]
MNKILIVDDDSSLSNSISIFFRNKNFIVINFQNVYSVLVFLKNNYVDLIIADILMPELDGYDLINILKSYKFYSSIPFIFLTAKGITSDKIKGYNLGCNSYITKPFDPNELLSIVNNLLNSYLFNNLKNNQNLSIDQKSTLYLNPLFKELTYREKSILKLVLKGYTNKEIANILQLSVRNVEKYVSRLLNKTNTRNRTELVNYIFRKTFL